MLRCRSTTTPSALIASAVRQLIGRPSITCVPRVLTTRPGASASSAPAITERAALPVHNVTTCGIGEMLDAGSRIDSAERYDPTVGIDVRRAGERFHTQLDWLDSWHSFSFGPHRDPANTHHGLLLVNNDDVVRGGRGFGTHPHRDMEIVTWVLRGELEHRDSTGTVGVIYPGLAQRMSAGSGITHSEMNASGTRRRAPRADVGAARHRRHPARLRAARRERRARRR